MEVTQKLKQPLHSNEMQWSEPCTEEKKLLLSDPAIRRNFLVLHQCGMTYLVFTQRFCNPEQNSSGFCSWPVAGSVAGSLEAVENRKRERIHKVETCTWSEAHEGLSQKHGRVSWVPLCCSKNQTWLGKHVLFPAKRAVDGLQSIELNIRDKGAEQCTVYW